MQLHELPLPDIGNPDTSKVGWVFTDFSDDNCCHTNLNANPHWHVPQVLE